MRLAGKICCNCKVSLPPPHVPGEHFCARCTASRAPRRRVYMSFMHREGWHCQFLEEDLKTSLPRKVSLDSPAKLIEMAMRGGSNLNLETRQALDHGIEIGRGGGLAEADGGSVCEAKEKVSSLYVRPILSTFR